MSAGSSPNTKFDIFVSYAHADDLTLDGSAGFVTKLCNAIRTFGRFKLGREIVLFRDRELASGSVWQEAIEKALAESAIFLPVVSASWESSAASTLEWKTFKSAFPEKARLSVVKPVFPILFEAKIQSIGGDIRYYQIRHRFTYTMSSQDFDAAADAAVSELVERIKEPGH